jgi:hypothetical protein
MGAKHQTWTIRSLAVARRFFGKGDWCLLLSKVLQCTLQKSNNIIMWRGYWQGPVLLYPGIMLCMAWEAPPWVESFGHDPFLHLLLSVDIVVVIVVYISRRWGTFNTKTAFTCIQQPVDGILETSSTVRVRIMEGPFGFYSDRANLLIISSLLYDLSKFHRL